MDKITFFLRKKGSFLGEGALKIEKWLEELQDSKTAHCRACNCCSVGLGAAVLPRSCTAPVCFSLYSPP